MTVSPRAAAVAAMNDADDKRTALAIASNPRPNALAELSERLGVSSENLKKTLMNTVFRGASESEFVSLVIIANAYKLNPLLKQMYAFPKKGGGIEPLISIDGWIHIMNTHPEFDGIEFDDKADDKGKLYAIEAIIYRKDRTRPTRIVEYLEECKRNTDPWQKTPARMLRHKAIIQCVRVAFGVAGMDEDEVIDGGALTPIRDIPVPTRSEAAQAQAEPVKHDADGVIEDDLQPADDTTATAEDGAQTIYDTLMGRINNAATVGSLNKAINDIPDTLPETWQSSLRERGIERDGELRGGK